MRCNVLDCIVLYWIGFIMHLYLCHIFAFNFLCLQRKDREYMQGLTANSAAIDHDEYLLRVEDATAVNEAIRDEAAKHRKSLHERLEVQKKQKQDDMEKHRLNLDIMHQEYQLKTDEWKDVKEYQKKQKERSRKSISMRLNSWRDQKMRQEEIKLQKELEREQDFELRQADFEAVQHMKSLEKYKL